MGSHVDRWEQRSGGGEQISALGRLQPSFCTNQDTINHVHITVKTSPDI